MAKTNIKGKLNKDFEKIIVARINQIIEEGTAIASVPDSHYNIYLRATTLNGFNFLAFTLLSPIEIKTMSGCTLTFKSKAGDYVLKSESDILATDFSNNANIGITLVDTDFLEDFDAFIKSTTIEEIKIDCKVGTIFKKKISFSYTEIDMKIFKEAMVPKEAESTGEISSSGGGSGVGI
jgi:polygalacturonase